MPVFHKMGKNGVIEKVPEKKDSDDESASGKDEEEKQGSAGYDGQSFSVTETSYITKSRCTEKSGIVKIKQVKHQLLEND